MLGSQDIFNPRQAVLSGELVLDLAGSICDDSLCMAMWFAILTGPFILAAAVAITLLARHIARQRGMIVSGWVWTMTFFGLVVILIPVAFGVMRLREHSQAERDYEAAARSIDYQTFWPAELPEGFEVTEVTAVAPPAGNNVTITYDTPAGKIQAYQEPSGGDHPGPEDCKNYDPDPSPDGRSVGDGTEASPHRFIPSTQNRCRLLITPRGNEVVITSPAAPAACHASLEIKETRLSIQCPALDDDAIARYFDSMKPIDPMDIGFSDPRMIDFL